MIQWTFDAVMDLDPLHTFVSTDDSEVADLAAEYNFNVMQRPPELADSSARMSDVIRHHLLDFRASSDDEELCVLYPTSPLRTTNHLIGALELWGDKKSKPQIKSLMSVTPMLHRPFGLMEIKNDDCLRCAHALGEHYYQAQSQPLLYRANGAIYILPFQSLRAGLFNSQLFINNATLPYVMDEVSGLEVDTKEDADLVEWHLMQRQLKMKNGANSCAHHEQQKVRVM